MTEPLRVAVAGVGNNISALVQGIAYYRSLAELSAESLPGIRRPVIGGIAVADVHFVAALDVDERKIGLDLRDAAINAPNNYPRLDVEVGRQDVTVMAGLEVGPGLRRHTDALAEVLREARAEVLLYSLPTGLQELADAYAELALEAGVGLVNCTPEVLGRRDGLLERFADAGLPLIGDDLASHVGSSVLHRALLVLLAERGATLRSSYQLNVGGNADFRNLTERGQSKRASKLNALGGAGVPVERVEVVPSSGFISRLEDRKVGMINIEAAGWAGTPITIDVKLSVQDSSNAAGVVIDLLRIAGAAVRNKRGGFDPAAAPLLKSPPGGHGPEGEQAVAEAWYRLEAPA